MSQKAGKPFTVVMFLLAASIILFALIHSAMPAEVSSLESSWVLELLRNIGFSDELSEHIVRKAAHFTEFTALGVICTCCGYCFDRFKPYKYYAHIMLTGLLTAVADETVQLFSEGRAGMVQDVLLDFSGVLTGFAAALLFFKIYILIKSKKSQRYNDAG